MCIFRRSDSSVSLTISGSSLITSASAQNPCIRTEHHCAPSREATRTAPSVGQKTSYHGEAAHLTSLRVSYGCKIKTGGRRSVRLRFLELLPNSWPSEPCPASVHKMADMIELGPTYGKTQATTSLIILEQCYRCVWTFENAVTRDNLSGREALRPTTVQSHTPWFLKRHVAKPRYFYWKYSGFFCIRTVRLLSLFIGRRRNEKDLLHPFYRDKLKYGQRRSRASALSWASMELRVPARVGSGWRHVSVTSHLEFRAQGGMGKCCTQVKANNSLVIRLDTKWKWVNGWRTNSSPS